MLNKPLFFIASLLLCSVSSAEEFKPYYELKLGLGDLNINSSLDSTSLTDKGYTINSYQAEKESGSTDAIGLSYFVLPRISIDVGIQNLGDINNSLDIELTEGITTEQAAEDILAANQQQLEGTIITLGGNYNKPINEKLDLRFGAGLLLGTAKHKVIINDEAFEAADENIKVPYVKFAVAGKVSQEFFITVAIERYFLESTTNRFEFGLNYSFK